MIYLMEHLLKKINHKENISISFSKTKINKMAIHSFSH